MKAFFNSKIYQVILTSLLVILPITSSLCIDMYLPAYSEMARDFMTSTGMVNLSMSVYLIGLAAGQLVYGPFADRYGRKKVLLLGLTLFCIASFTCSITPDLKIFLISRFFQAFGACSCIVLCRAIVADLFHPEKRTKVLALISASNIFSPAIAPLIGGYIATWYDWRTIFVIITYFGLFMLISMSIILKETLITVDYQALHFRHMISNFLRLIKNQMFLSYIICIAALTAMAFVWVTYAPEILVSTFGIPPDRFGLFFLIPSLGNTVGALYTAKFTSYYSERKLIIIGFIIIILGVILLLFDNLRLFTPTPIVILTAITLIFCGLGISGPQLISGAISPFVDIAGFTSGIIGFVQTTSGSLAGLATSYNYSAGYDAMGLMMLTLTTFFLLSFIINVLRPKYDLVLKR